MQEVDVKYRLSTKVKLIKDEIVRLMSKAAGEDVSPLFKRWTGFAAAQ